MKTFDVNVNSIIHVITMPERNCHMRKYYVVAETSKINKGVVEIKLTDNPHNYEILVVVEANNYAEAYRNVTFKKTINGESKYI